MAEVDQAGARMSALLLGVLKAIGGWLYRLPMLAWVCIALVCALCVSNHRYEDAAKLAADRLVVIE